MNELKCFMYKLNKRWSETYEKINVDINRYANDNNLIIKDIHYERFDDALIANVLFSTLPNELWLL